jgi:hypothetical protein
MEYTYLDAMLLVSRSERETHPLPPEVFFGPFFLMTARVRNHGTLFVA